MALYQVIKKIFFSMRSILFIKLKEYFLLTKEGEIILLLSYFMALKIKIQFNGKENNDRIKLNLFLRYHDVLNNYSDIFQAEIIVNASLVYHPIISTRTCDGLYWSKLVKVGSPSINVTRSEVPERGILLRSGRGNYTAVTV